MVIWPLLSTNGERVMVTFRPLSLPGALSPEVKS